MDDEIVIYKAVILCLREACGAGIPGRNPREFTQIQATLDGYLLSMASENAVSGIVKSLECRKTLLELSVKLGLANDPGLRAALRKDGERLAALLVSIFTSKSLEDAALRLEGDSAQCFLDVVQSTLDKGFLVAQDHSQMARRIIRKLSTSCDMLPSSLFITGITGKEEHPTFGGAYGDIYRASYMNQNVAMKHFRAVHYLRGPDLRRIRLKICREALVWKALHHPHILPFLGIDGDAFPSSLCIVSPWMEHGTVLNYLKEHGLGNVDRLLYEIAQGLQYLHSCNIVHGDLRGTNILIKEDWSACLADFGLSIFSDATSSVSTNRGGSLYWMAPELLDPERIEDRCGRSPASDVYAFGCVCFELYTGRPPFAHLPEPGAMMQVIMNKRPERPSNSLISEILWEYITTYWKDIPSGRPATEIVVQNMKSLSPPLVQSTESFSPASASAVPSVLPLGDQYETVYDYDPKETLISSDEAIPPHCLNTPSSTPADSHPAAYYVGEHGQFGLRGENHDTRDGVSYWKKLALSAMVKKKLFGLRRSKDEPLQLAVQQTSVEQEYSVRRGVNDDNTRSIEWFSHSFPTAVGSRRDAGFRSLRRVTPREKPNERMPFEAEDVIMRECAFASTVSANAPIFADYKVTPAGMQARNDDIQPEMPVADRVEDRSRLLHHVTEDGVLRPLREGPHGTELPRGLASSIRLVGQVSRSKTLDR